VTLPGRATRPGGTGPARRRRDGAATTRPEPVSRWGASRPAEPDPRRPRSRCGSRRTPTAPRRATPPQPARPARRKSSRARSRGAGTPGRARGVARAAPVPSAVDRPGGRPSPRAGGPPRRARAAAPTPRRAARPGSPVATAPASRSRVRARPAVRTAVGRGRRPDAEDGRADPASDPAGRGLRARNSPTRGDSPRWRAPTARAGAPRRSLSRPRRSPPSPAAPVREKPARPWFVRGADGARRPFAPGAREAEPRPVTRGGSRRADAGPAGRRWRAEELREEGDSATARRYSALGGRPVPLTGARWTVRRASAYGTRTIGVRGDHGR
jgi:hypothetical protein